MLGGFHFSTKYDDCTELSNRQFLVFAREQLEKEKWNEILCSWFETAILLIEQHGEQCRIEGEISDSLMHVKQLYMGMKNVYRTFT